VPQGCASFACHKDVSFLHNPKKKGQTCDIKVNPKTTELGMSSAFANDRIETARIGQGEKMKNSQTWVRAGDHLEGSPAP
jgi:hypothetical protein